MIKKRNNSSKSNNKVEQEWIDIWNARIRPLEKRIIDQFSKNLPVNILDLAKNLGVAVYTPYMETSLDGWIEFNEELNQFEIYLNQQYSASRQMFTLAHEVSHFLFHQEDIIEIGQIDRGYISKGFFDKREWQANLYASELLMPTNILTNLITDNIYYVDNVTSFASYLSNEAKVSQEAALKRAKRAIKHFKQINDLI